MMNIPLSYREIAFGICESQNVPPDVLPEARTAMSQPDIAKPVSSSLLTHEQSKRNSSKFLLAARVLLSVPTSEEVKHPQTVEQRPVT